MTTITRGKIAKQDINAYDGVTPTFQRKTTTGGIETLHKIDWPGVDIFSAYGEEFTDAVIKSAMALIGSRVAALYFAVGTWEISSDTEIPSNLVCRFPPGTTVNIQAGIALTISGEIQAGNYEVFTGPGILRGDASVPFDNGVWANDTVDNQSRFVPYDTLVSILDHSDQVVHKFPKQLLAQTSEWFGFH